MTSQRLIMLTFFLQPLSFGSWLPRIPDIQTRLGLGPQELAIALLGLPAGIMLTLPFAGRLVGRIGGRGAIRADFPVFLVLTALPGFAFNLGVLFLALLLVGIAMSVMELGLNVAADDIEKLTGSNIMSRCHGCWSLGMATGSLIGVGLAAAGLPPQYSILIVAVVVLPLAVIVSSALPTGPAHLPDADPPPHAGFFIPGPLLIGICVFAFGCTLVEGASADWSAVYLRDAIGAEAAPAGVGYTVFAVLVTVGRLLGDAAKRRWGAVPLARVLTSVAVVGALLVVFSPGYGVSLAGFALMGLGVSVAFPLGVSAVAAIGDRPAAANVAWLSMITLSGFLLGPPVIGFVAQHAGLRAGFAVVLPGLVASLFLVGLLEPKGASVPQPLEALPIGNGK